MLSIYGLSLGFFIDVFIVEFFLSFYFNKISDFIFLPEYNKFDRLVSGFNYSVLIIYEKSDILLYFYILSLPYDLSLAFDLFLLYDLSLLICLYVY